MLKSGCRPCQGQLEDAHEDHEGHADLPRELGISSLRVDRTQGAEDQTEKGHRVDSQWHGGDVVSVFPLGQPKGEPSVDEVPNHDACSGAGQHAPQYDLGRVVEYLNEKCAEDDELSDVVETQP